MRLSTLVTLAALGLGTFSTAACDGGGKTEGDTDTDTDADSDADSDADTDAPHTGDTADPILLIGYPGSGTYTEATGAYTGVESAGIYRYDTQPPQNFDDPYTALCEYTWNAIDAASDPNPGTANPIPNITGTPCAGCAFGTVLTLHGGTETGPTGGCGQYPSVGFDATFSDGYSFGYGYHGAYVDPTDGSELGESLLVYFGGNDTTPAGWYWNGPATYSQGAFTYIWVGDIVTLSEL